MLAPTFFLETMEMKRSRDLRCETNHSRVAISLVGEQHKHGTTLCLENSRRYRPPRFHARKAIPGNGNPAESLTGRARLAVTCPHEQEEVCPASKSPSSPSGLFLDGLTDEGAGLQYDLSVLEVDTASPWTLQQERDLEQSGRLDIYPGKV